MTQAPIHPRHEDMAAKAAGRHDFKVAERNCSPREIDSILAHAQTLANLEAARADLAEIDRIAKRNHWGEAANETFVKIATIAAPFRASDPEIPSSERDPVPAQSAVVEPRWQTEGDMSATCPKCEAFKREVSDALLENYGGKISPGSFLSRFIIPASDPVAEALKAAVKDCKYATLDCIEGEFATDLRTALASRGLEIVERGDR